VRPGHIIILGTVLVGLAAVAAVYTPSWKSTDDGAFRILPLLASMNIDRMGPPSWDGRFVPYRNNKAELMLYNVATKESHRVLDHPASERQGILQFIASPDGSRIAYQLESLDGPGQLRIVNADGSGDRLLFTDPKYATIKPTSWSQDGQSIAAILTEKDDASSVGVIKVSDGSLRVLRRSSRLTNAMFSANSRFIAYTEARDIFVIPSAGGAPVGVVVHPANDNLLGWAPDGRLAFTSDRSGKNDIWAVEFHEGKPAQAPQVLSEDFNLTPLGITATGDLVYDRSEMENQLSTAELDAAGRLVAPPTNLGGGRYEEKNSAPDYSRDGNFLAYVSGMKGSQQ